MVVEFDTTILGGLPVLCHARVTPAEPDIGIWERYVDSYVLYWMPRKNVWVGKQSLQEIPRTVYERLTNRDVENIEAGALTS